MAKSTRKAASSEKKTPQAPKPAAEATQGGLSAGGLNTTGLNIKPPKKGD